MQRLGLNLKVSPRPFLINENDKSMVRRSCPPHAIDFFPDTPSPSPLSSFPMSSLLLVNSGSHAFIGLSCANVRPAESGVAVWENEAPVNELPYLIT